jgi:hypothetical protein
MIPYHLAPALGQENKEAPVPTPVYGLLYGAKFETVKILVRHQLRLRNIKLKGQSHENVGEMRVEGDSLGPN